MFKGTDLEMGRLSWITQVGRIEWILKSRESFPEDSEMQQNKKKRFKAREELDSPLLTLEMEAGVCEPRTEGGLYKGKALSWQPARTGISVRQLQGRQFCTIEMSEEIDSPLEAAKRRMALLTP